jgi:O-antigen/teichoic acid export membrane protein
MSLAKFTRRFALHPFIRDVGVTTATQFSIMAVNLLMASLFGRLIGAVALGEYLLLRRVVSGLQSAAQLGLGVAVPRFVAISATTTDKDRTDYFIAGSSCLIALAICSGLLLTSGRYSFAKWLFGSTRSTYLILPLAIWLLALAAHVAVYGYYRGCLAMFRANALQFVNLVLVPLITVVFLFRTHSVALIMSCMGACMFACAVIFAIPLLRDTLGRQHTQLPSHAAELLRYGIPRVPGDFGGGALMAAGPMIASHYAPMSEVSYLLLAMTFLMAVGYAAAPLGLVLLSKVSMMIAEKRIDEVRAQVGYLVDMILALSAFITLQLLVFSDVLVGLWVGPKFRDAVPLVQVLSLAIPFHLIYVSFGSVIDAATRLPYDSRNVFISLFALLVLTASAISIAPPHLLLLAVALAIVAGLGVLAALSIHTVQRLYNMRISWRHSLVPALMSVGFALVTLSFRRLRGVNVGIVDFAAVEIVCGVLFLMLLKKMNSPWVNLVWSMVFPGSAAAVGPTTAPDQRTALAR